MTTDTPNIDKYVRIFSTTQRYHWKPRK